MMKKRRTRKKMKAQFQMSPEVMYSTKGRKIVMRGKVLVEIPEPKRWSK